MIISEIRVVDRQSSKVFIDGDFAFILYNKELRKLGVIEGRELSETTYNEIKCGLLPKRAKLRAMNLLQRKDYTEMQLRNKLAERMFPSDVVDAAIDYVKSYKYLDDRRYAYDYINYHMNSRSKSRITFDLINKGIPQDIITEKLEELYVNGTEESEIPQIKQLLTKKKYDSETFNYKDKQKLMSFLVSKGYTISAIKKAMEVE